jgi:hypothetical protein
VTARHWRLGAALWVGLDYAQAVSMVEDGTMPASPLGSSTEFLVELLAA